MRGVVGVVARRVVGAATCAVAAVVAAVVAGSAVVLAVTDAVVAGVGDVADAVTTGIAVVGGGADATTPDGGGGVGDLSLLTTRITPMSKMTVPRPASAASIGTLLVFGRLPVLCQLLPVVWYAGCGVVEPIAIVPVATGPFVFVPPPVTAPACACCGVADG